MKKYQSSVTYTIQNFQRSKDQLQRRTRSKFKKTQRNKGAGIAPKITFLPSKRKAGFNPTKPPVFAPEDLRLLGNALACLAFFRALRSDDHLSKRGLQRYVIMSLKNVRLIDYASISVLTAINDEFKFKKIYLRTILPDNVVCKQFMIESGYLNNLFDDFGRPFPKSTTADLIFFEKGSGVLSEKDNIKISLLIKNVVKHLTGVEKYSLPVKTIILEICGNSIEWSGTESKQWLLGVRYETDKVLFTVTDVGRGILKTLFRRFSKVVFEAFTSDCNILKGAFDKKYGSTTQEENRNKGLPAVKANFQKGVIKELKVLTNNVILDFANDDLSRAFPTFSPRFKGTFYQWEMTTGCLEILENERNQRS